jgi:predicted nuclease with RNAse H fold
VSELDTGIIIGIDLAGRPENPTGWTVLRNKTVRTRLVHADNKILEDIACNKPSIIAIDAPFSLPKESLLRRAYKEMIGRGLRIFPPNLHAMRSLTMRAMELNRLIAEGGYKTIEVHPTSTQKALDMPSKDWKRIQAIPRSNRPERQR